MTRSHQKGGGAPAGRPDTALDEVVKEFEAAESGGTGRAEARRRRHGEKGDGRQPTVKQGDALTPSEDAQEDAQKNAREDVADDT
ncbi:hypothetical protein [Streptomyces sp. NPDC008001]|uniref:hypothetical protein n=1 Tax=Streptomyces sp. NPDC008001 TaxID=3364804 RepID=UPI0036E46360